MSKPKRPENRVDLFSNEALRRYLVVGRVRAKQALGLTLAEAIAQTIAEPLV
jgi:hypothetical protein